MPFDPSFTPEEAEAAIAADPKIIDRLLPVLGKKDYVVRSKTEDATYTQTIEGRKASEITKQHADAYEKDFADILGVKKADPNQKYFEFGKTTLTTLATEKKALADELALLKSKSSLSEAEKIQLQEAKDAIAANNKKITEMESGHAKALTEANARGDVKMAIASARAGYLKTIPEGVIKATEGVYTAQMMAAARFTDSGELYFVGADGKTPQLNNKTQQFMSADEVYAIMAKDLFDPGQKQEGTGLKPAPATSVDKLPATIKNRSDADDWLKASGLVQGTPAYNKKYNDLKIGELPLR